MIYFYLFWEFFKIGLLSIGGGYATLPFLYYLAQTYHWFSAKELTEMLAISNITPGPIGINMATYAGFKAAGVTGSIISTIAIILPAIIIVSITAKLLTHFEKNKYVKTFLECLKPTTCAMLFGIGIKLFADNIMSIKRLNCASSYKCFHVDYSLLTIVCILLILSLKPKLNPIIIIFLGGFMGLLFRTII